MSKINVVLWGSFVTIVLSVIIVLAHAFSVEFATFIVSASGLLILLIAIGSLAAAKGLTDTPELPLKLLDSKTEVTILDHEGKLANVVKTQKVVAVISDVKEMIDRGLFGVGDIEVTKAECDDLRVDWVPKRITPGAKDELHFIFEDSPAPGRVYNRKLFLTMHDCFPENIEYYKITISRSTNWLELVINFPLERPVKRAWLKYRDQFVLSELHSPDVRIEEVNGRALRIIYSARNPRLGSTHQLMWEW